MTPAGLRKPLAQNLDRLRVIIDGDAECLGDGVGGDVVVGRPDPAGGEDIGVARPQRVERGDDFRLFVRNHPHLFEIDADGGEIVGDEADILVLGPAGQDFVADDQKPGRDDPALIFCVGRAAHVQTFGPMLTLSSHL